MKVVLVSLLVLKAVGMVACAPGEELRKVDTKKTHLSHMYYSIDLAFPISKSICISEQKEIDGNLYRDITVKPGIVVNEVYSGDNEIWKAKPNRDLMKLIVIQSKDSYTYIVITKDKTNRLAETLIIVTKVTMTFNSFKDLDYPLMNYSVDPVEGKGGNLRSAEAQTEPQDSREGKDIKAPFQNREYMNQLLPRFVTRPKFREMDEAENKNKEPVSSITQGGKAGKP